ncbi:MAG: DUF4405 domain-containing protein [Thermoleophilia bacterium]
MTAPTHARGRRRPTGTALLNYILGFGLFAAFAVDYNLRFTGLNVHEWLGIVLGAMVLFHILMHGDWISRTTRRITTVRARQRVSAVLTLLTFADIILVVATGLLISRDAVPGLAQQNGGWRDLHSLTAHIGVFLIALHVALSWRWLWGLTKRLLHPGTVPSVGREAA